ncbi:hypothetical protein Sulac_3388 [Sulfobacillus acidophilus DSM 10332]|uniref:Uncharacterized protein n=1 Tax=Sulfobacillus acidophilus (strain ATCC 700253 / DSM 10332 / NAL) TaxID=679936 RepID=G8TTS2_SULAD|nr:hypothetical protein Sulac_3388 [Sulfobacillus acidophilus DSM 10332]
MVSRTWGWFHDPKAMLALLKHQARQPAIDISLIMADPKHPEQILVLGPLSDEMACYPFLDVTHHFRRLGVKRSLAEHYIRVIQAGGIVVAVDRPAYSGTLSPTWQPATP